MKAASVFSLDQTSIQIVWASSPGGELSVTCGGITSQSEIPKGPGTALVEGLSPGTMYQISIKLNGAKAFSKTFSTLNPPPGEELFRFATVSDTHFGKPDFGVFGSIVDDHGDPAARCTRAALEAAHTWGSEHLIVKGDLVDGSHKESWADASAVLKLADSPVTLIPGNHEMKREGTVDARAEAAIWGFDMVKGVETIDVPGIRLVLMDSSVDGIDIGRWNHLRAEAVEAVSSTNLPAMLIVHHNANPLPVPVYLPRGIPSFAAKKFAKAIRAANPNIIATSGHTHRHRRYELEGIPWSEVGSPKDYPGTWAGYVVYEGGITQTVRKVSAPDCLGWLQQTSSAAGGAWKHWSPGRLDQRCFAHSWAEQTPK